MHAKPGSEIDQRVANVVAVADVGELEPAQCAEFFFECEEVRERLARMKFVRKRIDHGDVRVGGHFLKDALVVNASDDALHPAIEVAHDIRNGLPGAKRGRGLRVVEKNDGAAHALDADIEGDARAQRGLFKDQGDKFTLQRGGVTDGARLDVRRELEQFARVRGAPLRSGEQIIR